MNSDDVEEVIARMFVGLPEDWVEIGAEARDAAVAMLRQQAAEIRKLRNMVETVALLGPVDPIDPAHRYGG
jgi:hypothetical protein